MKRLKFTEEQIAFALKQAELAFVAYVFINDRTVRSPRTGFAAGSLHWPGNRPVRFGY